MSGSPLPPDPLSCLRLWACGGEERAFAAVVEAYSGLVFNTARQCLGGDAEGAREVAQNVFLTAARKAPQLAALDGLSAWFHSAAMREAANHRRGEERRRKRQEIYARDATRRSLTFEAAMKPASRFAAADDSEFPAAPGTGNSGPSVGAGIDTEALRAHLNEALNSLNSAERGILLSRFFENRSFTAIAGSQGSSPDAVRMKCRRAMDKLARWLRRRGLTAESLTLGSVLAIHWSQPAPEHVAAAIHSAVHHLTSHAGAAGAAAVRATTTFTAMASAKSLTAAAMLLAALIPLHSQNERIRQLEAEQSAAFPPRSGPEKTIPKALRGAAEFIPLAMDEGVKARLTFPLTAAGLMKAWLTAGSSSAVRPGTSYPFFIQLEKQKLLDLPASEFQRLLADLDPLPAGEDIKRAVRCFLLEFCLAGKEPQTALETALSARLDTPVLGRIVQQWASSDPAAAQAWLEKRRDEGRLIPQRFGEDPEAALWTGVTRALAKKDLTAAADWAEASISTSAAPALLRGLAPEMAARHEEERFLDLARRLVSPKAVFEAQSQLLAHVLQGQRGSAESWNAGIRLLENPGIASDQREAMVLEALRIRITDPDIQGGRNAVFGQAWALSPPEKRRGVLLKLIAFRAPEIDSGSPTATKVDALMADIAQALAPVDSTRDFQFLEAIKNPDARKSLRSEFAPFLPKP